MSDVKTASVVVEFSGISATEWPRFEVPYPDKGEKREKLTRSEILSIRCETARMMAEAAKRFPQWNRDNWSIRVITDESGKQYWKRSKITGKCEKSGGCYDDPALPPLHDSCYQSTVKTSANSAVITPEKKLPKLFTCVPHTPAASFPLAPFRLNADAPINEQSYRYLFGSLGKGGLDWAPKHLSQLIEKAGCSLVGGDQFWGHFWADCEKGYKAVSKARDAIQKELPAESVVVMEESLQLQPMQR